jgi:hypothetical protein
MRCSICNCVLFGRRVNRHDVALISAGRASRLPKFPRRRLQVGTSEVECNGAVAHFEQQRSIPGSASHFRDARAPLRTTAPISAVQCA